MSAPAPAYDYEIDFPGIVRRLRAALPLILASVVVGALVAGIASFLVKPTYIATATIVPVVNEQRSGAAALRSQLGGLANLAGIDMSDASQGRAQHSVPYLQSRILAETFVLENDLVGRVFDGNHPSSNPPTLWNATERFRKRVLRVNVDRRTNLISVGIEWTDPDVAAGWANGFVDLANERLRRRDQERAERNIAFLNDQLSNTSIIGLRQVLLNLLETEMRSAMLANVDVEYAFNVIDPATVAERPSKPRRLLMIVVGALAGGILSLIMFPFIRPFGRGAAISKS